MKNYLILKLALIGGLFSVLFLVIPAFYPSYNYAEDTVDTAEETVDTAETTEVEATKTMLPTSFWYIFIEIKEAIQLNLFTFKDSSKATLLEDFCDQRVNEMVYADSIGDNDAVEMILNRYEEQKTKALEYAEASDDDSVIDHIEEGTLEQQQTMTQVQLRLENAGELQKNMVQVQTEVASSVQNTIEEAQGKTEANQFEEKVRVIWMDPNADEFGNLPPLPDDMGKWEYAPGTEGRNDNGAVIKYIEIKEDPGGGGSGGSGGKVEQVVDVEN